MATVLFSDTTKSRILREAASQFDVRRAPIVQRVKEVLHDNDLHQALRDSIYDEMGVTQTKLSAYAPWLQSTNRLTINSINSIVVPNAVRSYGGFHVNTSFTMYWPTQPTRTIRDGAYSSPRLAKWGVELKRCVDQLDEIQKEQQSFITNLEDLMRKARSLNHAVKVWPEIKNVVPRDIWERYEQKVDRQRSNEKVEIDAEALNITLVKNVIASSAAGRKEPV